MRTATLSAEVEAATRANSGSRLVPAQSRSAPEQRGGGGGRSDPVVEEVRSSIEFFLSHAQGVQIDQVQLTGGSALTAGLTGRLAAALDIPVVPASLTATFERAALALDEEQFRDASQRWTTAVGLALWGSEGGHAPSLLPAEIQEKSRQRATIVAAAAGVVVVAGALGVLSHARTGTIASVNKQTAVDNQETAVLQAEETRVNAFPQVLSRVETSPAPGCQRPEQRDRLGEPERPDRKGTPCRHAPDEHQLRWYRRPSERAGRRSRGASPSPYVGTLTMSGQAIGGLPAVASFVKKLSAVPGVGAVWVSSSNQAVSGTSQSAQSSRALSSIPQTQGPPAPLGTTFSATAEVTTAALSHRASQLPGGTR